jgi:ElaB/YqjD/DUF883 family membrane-anchored ribosome-binding protein
MTYNNQLNNMLDEIDNNMDKASDWISQKWEDAQALYHKWMAESNNDVGDKIYHRMEQTKHEAKAAGHELMLKEKQTND